MVDSLSIEINIIYIYVDFLPAKSSNFTRVQPKHDLMFLKQ